MYSELYDQIIKRAAQKFNLDPEILKHVDTRLIVNALLLPNNHNTLILKSHYDEIAKKFGAWRNFNHCVSDMKRRQGYSDEVAKKVCGKLKHKLEKTTATTSAMNVKQQVDETAEQVSEQLVNKINEKLEDALKQWEMVLKKITVQRNKDGSLIIPDYAERFMTDVRLVAKPVNTSPPPDGVVKSLNNDDKKPAPQNGQQMHQINQEINQKLTEQLDKPVITKDHQGKDSYHVTLYFATPEPKTEQEIKQFIESTGAMVLDYQPASGYWLDPNNQLVGDEFVHVVTIDVKPEQLAELDRKIKSEFKQSSVLITSADNIDGYTGGKILRYEIPKSEDEIRKLLIELSQNYGGATYLRGKNPAIITIAQISGDEKPEVYYHFT
jgi:hypothetical protein